MISAERIDRSSISTPSTFSRACRTFRIQPLHVIPSTSNVAVSFSMVVFDLVSKCRNHGQIAFSALHVKDDRGRGRLRHGGCKLFWGTRSFAFPDPSAYIRRSCLPAAPYHSRSSSRFCYQRCRFDCEAVRAVVQRVQMLRQPSRSSTIVMAVKLVLKARLNGLSRRQRLTRRHTSPRNNRPSAATTVSRLDES